MRLSACFFAMFVSLASPLSATVTVTKPVGGQTVNSPVSFVATATTTCSKGVSTMGVYVDNVLDKNSVVNGASLNTTVSIAPGAHHTVVEEWDRCGGATYTAVNITVAGVATGVGVTVTSPTPGSTVTSPVTYTATATTACSKGVASMGVYVDNVLDKNTVVSGASLNTAISLAPGAQHTVVEEWDFCGGAAYATDNITVAPSGPVPTVSVSASPASIALGASSTLTVTATNSTSLSVAGSDGTSYDTLGPTGGTLTVTPTASTTYKVTASGNGITASAAALVAVTPPTLIDYTGYKGNVAGTGANTNEVLLTPADLTSSHFGTTWSFQVDGSVSAQLLYVHALTINGVTHNVLFVATNNDSVYALDANSGTQLWKRSFLSSGVTAVNLDAYGQSIVGILSTPVIDTTTQTMYLVAWTAESNNTVFPRRLHAVNITTGGDAVATVAISNSAMQPLLQLQRPALLLLNGTIYVAFGSVGDITPYHGLLFAFDESTLAQKAVWNDTSGGTEGGIWMSGAAPTADSSGDIYLSVGNGTFNGKSDFGQSTVKFSPALSVLDYFTPINYNSLNVNDVDLGAGGPIVVPDQPGAYPHELIACGKPTPIYVINRDNMGKLGTSSDNVIQELDNVIGNTGNFKASGQPCFNSPAIWNNNVYFAANHDVLKMFAISPTTGKLSETSSGSTTYLYPGANPVVSSNGTTNGIVWTVEVGTATLHANDATDVSKSLYVSPSMGSVFRWVPPTVVNGYVYVEANNKVVAYTNF
jgi:hypothetical protein